MTSNRLGEGPSSSIKVSKVSRDSDGAWSSEEVPTDLEMGNGGINYGNEDEILFNTQGTHTSPSGLTLMSTHPPYATRPLLDNFHGLQFNSPNDIVRHTDGSIWFTDPIYGFEKGAHTSGALTQSRETCEQWLMVLAVRTGSVSRRTRKPYMLLTQIGFTGMVRLMKDERGRCKPMISNRVNTDRACG
jgi:hypothetical protein